jgi:replicative DNA helicase
VVLFINRPNFYKTDLPDEDRAKAELIIAKQRNGPTGRVNLAFLKNSTRFESMLADGMAPPE